MLLRKWLFAPLLIVSLTGCADDEAPPAEDADKFQQEGKASFYGPGFHGEKTASGEVFDQNELVGAHKELPFGTKVEVTNLENGESVEVRINDRGPYKPGRIIDLSVEAAKQIDLIEEGVAPVQIEEVD